MLQLLIAALHLLALGLGLSSVITRGSALRENPPTEGSLKRAFLSDALWGIAALLWIGTGVWRLIAGLDKPTLYYMKNFLFHAKLTLVVLIIALEVWPAIVLMRWRQALQSGRAAAGIVEAKVARRIATISHVQALCVVIIVFLAVSMARGRGIIPA